MRTLAGILGLALVGCAGQQAKPAAKPQAQAQTAQQKSETAQNKAPSPPPSPPAQDVLDRLRETVHALSTEQWQDARKTGAAALHDLAKAIGAAGGPRMNDRVKKLHQLADAVSNAGALDYSEKTRAALEAAVEAIEILGGGRAEGLQGWTASAKKAVQDISSRTPFELQRAAIQDAFRAVVDAYGVTSGSACTAKVTR
jgi:hypothetical protein